jgi:TPR repeat protein
VAPPDILPDLTRVHFKLEEPQQWPIFISGPCSRGIDSKSLFILGIYADARHEPREAWAYFSKSAEAGYIPALYLLSSVYTSESNPYGVKPNPERTHDPRVAIRAADLLIQAKRYGQARAILETCAGASPEAKLKLANLLSPLDGQLSDAPTALRLYAELAEQGETGGMRRLALDLTEGGSVGIERDVNRAWQLLKRANELDGHGKQKVVSSGTVGAVACIVVAVGVIAFLWRRRQGIAK